MAKICLVTVIVTVQFEVHAAGSFQRKVIAGKYEMTGGGVYTVGTLSL